VVGNSRVSGELSGLRHMLTLPEDLKAGDLIECCGRNYRLTFEYGAYAAEAS